MSLSSTLKIVLYVEMNSLKHLGRQKALYYKVLCVDLKVKVILCRPNGDPQFRPKHVGQKPLSTLLRPPLQISIVQK